MERETKEVALGAARAGCHVVYILIGMVVGALVGLICALIFKDDWGLPLWAFLAGGALLGAIFHGAARWLLVEVLSLSVRSD